MLVVICGIILLSCFVCCAVCFLHIKRAVKTSWPPQESMVSPRSQPSPDSDQERTTLGSCADELEDRWGSPPRNYVDGRFFLCWSELEGFSSSMNYDPQRKENECLVDTAHAITVSLITLVFTILTHFYQKKHVICMV